MEKRAPHSSRSWIVAGAAALAGVAAEARAAETEPRARLALVDAVGLPALTARVLPAEPTAILAPAIGPPSWRRLRPREELREIEIPAVLLAREPLSDGRLVLGSVPRRTPRPVAWIYLAPVMRALGLTRAPEVLSGPEQRRLGLALGRVTAHELVHALSPRGGHAAAGLMARHLGPAHLTAGRPGLDPVSAQRLRCGLTAWVTRPRGQSLAARESAHAENPESPVARGPEPGPR